MKGRLLFFGVFVFLAVFFFFDSAEKVFAAHTITLLFNDTGSDRLIRGGDVEFFNFTITNNGADNITHINFTIPQHTFGVNFSTSSFFCVQNTPHVNCSNTTVQGIAVGEIFTFNISVTANSVNSTQTLTVRTFDNASATQTNTDWSVTIDSTNPSLNITNPSSGNVTGTITVNATMSDLIADNSSVAFAFGNATNNYTKTGTVGFTTLTQEGSTNFFSDASVDTTNLADGVYTLYVRANDTVDNQNITSISITVDNILPSITINAPSGVVGGSSVTVNATMTDTNLDTGTGEYSISDGVNNYTKTKSVGFSSLTKQGATDYFTDTFDSALFSDGSYTIWFRVNDSAGNQKVSSSTFTITQPVAPVSSPVGTTSRSYHTKYINLTFTSDGEVEFTIIDADVVPIVLFIIRPAGVTELFLEPGTGSVTDEITYRIKT